MMSRIAAGLEGLDDDHAAAAAGARVRERWRLAVVAGASVAGLARWRRHAEQLARSGDVLGASAIGEETVVADGVGAAGQHGGEEGQAGLGPPQRGKPRG